MAWAVFAVAAVAAGCEVRGGRAAGSCTFGSVTVSGGGAAVIGPPGGEHVEVSLGGVADGEGVEGMRYTLSLATAPGHLVRTGIDYKGDGGYSLCCRFVDGSRCEFREKHEVVLTCPVRPRVTGRVRKPLPRPLPGAWEAVLVLLDAHGELGRVVLPFEVPASGRAEAPPKATRAPPRRRSPPGGGRVLLGAGGARGDHTASRLQWFVSSVAAFLFLATYVKWGRPLARKLIHPD